MSGTIRRVVLDTSYLLPAFGVDIAEDSTHRIREALVRFVRGGGSLLISDLSPLEAWLKSRRLARQEPNGQRRASEGFLAVWQDRTFQKIPHSDPSVFSHANRLLESHADPFDCFVFATSLFADAPLVTQDEAAATFLRPGRRLSWRAFTELTRTGA